MSDRDAFIARFGGIYENAPWAAAGAWDQGARGDDLDGVRTAMHRHIEFSDRARKLQLLCAHPDLAGKLSLAELTPESSSEQCAAGLDNCTSDELAEFQHLNDAYKARFGFPFILAVKGHTRATILDVFRRRVTNDPDTEFAEALSQVHQIAGYRLETMAENAP